MKMAIRLDELDNADKFEDGNPAMPYLHTMCLVPNILHVLNQRAPNTRNLRMV